MISQKMKDELFEALNKKPAKILVEKKCHKEFLVQVEGVQIVLMSLLVGAFTGSPGFYSLVKDAMEEYERLTKIDKEIKVKSDEKETEKSKPEDKV